MNQENFIALLAKKLNGSITEAESAALEAAMNSQPEWARQAEILSKYWQTPLKTEVPEAAWLAHAALLGQQPVLRPAWKRRLPAIAACAAALLGGVLLLQHFRATRPAEITSVRETGPQARLRIVLPDSSLVMLNANSTLQFDSLAFVKGDRSVSISGGGYFDVHHDPRHPFIVHLPSGTIRVLGTAFNINDYNHSPEADISLLRGKITFTPKQATKTYTLLPGDKIVIRQGQQESVANAPVAAIAIKKTDTVAIAGKPYVADTAWMQDMLVLRNNQLKDLVPMLENRYGVKIIIQDEEVGAYSYSGEIGNNTLPQLLLALSSIHPFSYEEKGGNIILKKL